MINKSGMIGPKSFSDGIVEELAIDNRSMKKAIILGAGPAGLVAAYELLTKTDIIPIILENSSDIGGLFRTYEYKGNRIDICGDFLKFDSEGVYQWLSDFFSKSVASPDSNSDVYHVVMGDGEIPSVSSWDKRMVKVRPSCHVFYGGALFNYPLHFSFRLLSKIGFCRSIETAISYLIGRIFPCKPERGVEGFFRNYYGDSFYRTFIEGFIRKIYGVSDSNVESGLLTYERRISRFADMKLSLTNIDSLDELGNLNSSNYRFDNFFYYPKFGMSQLFDEMAKSIEVLGGKIFTNCNLNSIHFGDSKTIESVTYTNTTTGEKSTACGDYFFSTVPVPEIIRSIDHFVPQNVLDASNRLYYRNLLTVAVLLKNISYQVEGTTRKVQVMLRDTLIQVYDRDIKVACIKVFNNWSPFMVDNSKNIWIGMEYYCDSGEAFWDKKDQDIIQFAISELERMGWGTSANVLDATVIRSEKVISGIYGGDLQFSLVREYTDQVANLFLIGGNGTHTNNRLANSILTSVAAVGNICCKTEDKSNIWKIASEHKGRMNISNPEAERQTLHSDHRSGDESIYKSMLSLKDFIFKDKFNKWLVGIGIPVLALQFLIFKFLYPYASFINGDSYVYLETGYHNLIVNTYPIGYSKFIRLFSVFTHSDTALVAFQFLLLHLSTFALIFTIFYFYRPTKMTRVLLFGFMLLQPIYLYLANYISSDSFFLSLSLIWFTMLIWIMNHPTNKLIIINALVLFIAFTVRYNALFYPAIGGVALLLTRRKVLVNILGFVLSMGLIGLFIHITSEKYKELTGYYQFTPFTGWQMANNALYAYRYVDQKDRLAAPPELQSLDSVVRNYFDTSRDVSTHPMEAIVASTVYMWDPRSPLTMFMEKQFVKDTTASALKKWAAMAPLMKKYGDFLIKSYPHKFARYYLFPNAVKYYVPPVEFLAQYSTGVDSVHVIAKVWFDYKSNKISCYFKDFDVNILNYYPVLTGTMNVILVLSILSFFVLRGHSLHPQLKKGIVLVGALWIVNFGFSVFASPIALRFQMFPIIVSASFTFLMVEFLIKSASSTTNEYAKDSYGEKIHTNIVNT